MNKKRCSKCKEVFAVSCFQKNHSRPDRLKCTCKECCSKIAKRYRTKLKKQPLLRLKKNLNNQIKRSIGKKEKGTRWQVLINWTFEELVAHLETTFRPGMTWDNYGRWHLDHIKPVYGFNITDARCDEFKQCWALGNLQALWAMENQIKGKQSFANILFDEEENFNPDS